MFDVTAYSEQAQGALKALKGKAELYDNATEKRYEAHALMVKAFVPFFQAATEADIRTFEMDFRGDGTMKRFIPLFTHRMDRALFKRKEGEKYGILLYGTGIKAGKENGILADVLVSLANSSESLCAGIRHSLPAKEKAEEKPELPSVREEAEKRYNAMLDGVKMAIRYSVISEKAGNEILDKLTDNKRVAGIILAIAGDVRTERMPKVDALSEALDDITD